MHRNKAQVSIFLAFMITLLLFGALIITSTTVEKKEIQRPVDFDQHFFFVEHCLEEKAKSVLIDIGFGGGLYNVKPPLIAIGQLKHPFYLLEGENFMPTIDDIEKQLEIGMQIQSPNCVQELETATSNEEPKIEVNILDSAVLFNIYFPVTIQQEDYAQTKKEFLVKVPTDIKQLIEVIEEFIEEDQKNPEMSCIGCLQSLGKKNDFVFEIDYLEHTGIVSIVQQNSAFPVIWVFANEY